MTGQGSRQTGDIAMFPRGAIDYPALFASACVLFDSVTVLRPIDVEATHWKDGDHVWTYKRCPDPNADAFWEKTAELSATGALHCFRPHFSENEIDNRIIAPNDEIRADCAEQLDGNDMWATSLHSLGFNRFVEYIDTVHPSLVLASDEMDSPLLEHRVSAKPIVDLSIQNSLAARILSECIPDLGAAGQNPDHYARKIAAIRKQLSQERLHFRSFVGLISNTLSGLSGPEEKAAQVELLVQDCAEIYHAYRSKLMEITRRLELPLRFVSILKNIVTLDLISAAKDTAGLSKANGVQIRQEQRALAFVRHVDELSHFWISR